MVPYEAAALDLIWSIVLAILANVVLFAIVIMCATLPLLVFWLASRPPKVQKPREPSIALDWQDIKGRR